MSQKSRFRMQMQGSYKHRWTFPQLPWGTLKNPTYLQTAHVSLKPNFFQGAFLSLILMDHSRSIYYCFFDSSFPIS